MANGKPTRIKAAEALKALGAQLKGVTVQVATPTKVIDKETGVEKPAFKTSDEPIAEKHVLAAKRYPNGQVTIVTIDGRRYPPNANVAADRDELEEAAA
jgi:hypothetical protein